MKTKNRATVRFAEDRPAASPSGARGSPVLLFVIYRQLPEWLLIYQVCGALPFYLAFDRADNRPRRAIFAAYVLFIVIGFVIALA